MITFNMELATMITTALHEVETYSELCQTFTMERFKKNN